MSGFIIKDETPPSPAPPQLDPPKLTIQAAAELILPAGIMGLVLTDEHRARVEAHAQTWARNPQQAYGRTLEQIRPHAWHILADELLATLPGFELNPEFVARDFSSSDRETQVPDIIHSDTGTQFEIKTLKDSLEAFTMYPVKSSALLTRPDRVDMFILGRARVTPETYFFKPVQVFLRSSLFDANTLKAARYALTNTVNGQTQWKYMHGMARADGVCAYSTDRGPIR